MNKDEIVARARAITDLDETDVPAALVDMFVKDGFERIVAIERMWPTYEVSTSLPTVVDQQTYPIADLGDDDNWREVSSVVDVDNSYRLQYISHDEAEATWSSSYVGRSTNFSVWGGDLYLWPTPSEVTTLSLRGYRFPDTWYTAGDTEVDADARLHQGLVYYVVSMMYQLLEDTELAAAYRQSFNEAVQMARDDIMRPPVATPLILSGGRVW